MSISAISGSIPDIPVKREIIKRSPPIINIIDGRSAT